MINQYGAQRFRYSRPMVQVQDITYRRRGLRYRVIAGEQRYVPAPSARRIGTIPVGSIFYLQDRIDRYNRPIFRNPWIVEAWVNRDYFPCVKGRPEVLRMAGGHLAQVRSLRNNQVRLVADWMLLLADDNGWVKY